MYKTKSIYTEAALKSILEEFSGCREEGEVDEELSKKEACFVTLHNKNGDLRGCIGTLEPVRENLYEEIRGNAKSAAFGDPRFSPLREEELLEIEISVDVLGKAEKISDMGELDPKIYGVIVSDGYKRGVLLPDIEGVDSGKQQVDIAKSKAGIFPGEEVEIYRFKVKRYH